MAKYRQGRVNEEVRRELAEVLRDIKDPRVPDMISIISCEVTPDLKYAKVRVSFFGNEDAQKDGIKGLRAAAGFIRRELSHRMSLRQIPELNFVQDDSIAYGAHINQVLKEIADKENPDD